MPDFIEQCIRYVHTCAGEGFDDAEALMNQAYKDAGISLDQDEPLEALIEVVTA